MKNLRTLLVGMLVTGTLTIAGCGGGGGGSSSGGGGGGGTQPPAGSITFNMVELAGFGGDFSAGVAINDAGLAVGFAHDGISGSVKGAKWTVTDAAPLATELSPLTGNLYSAAYGVNSTGIAVGESGDTVAAVPDANTVAVYWPSGTVVPTELSTTGLFVGGASAAFAVNDTGEIVGEAVADADGNTVAVYWADIGAAPLSLGNLNGGSFSSAYFIGADGRIVGEAQNGPSGQAQAVVWLPAVGVGYQAPVALSAVANQSSSVAFGVDLNGRIVGEAELTSGVVQGVIWSANGSVASSLGANTSIQAINDVNRVVGYTAALSGNDRAAFWNTANFADFQNLSTLFSHAYGLNDSNQIVGFAGNRAVAAVPQ